MRATRDFNAPSSNTAPQSALLHRSQYLPRPAPCISPTEGRIFFIFFMHWNNSGVLAFWENQLLFALLVSWLQTWHQVFSRKAEAFWSLAPSLLPSTPWPRLRETMVWEVEGGPAAIHILVLTQSRAGTDEEVRDCKWRMGRRAPADSSASFKHSPSCGCNLFLSNCISDNLLNYSSASLAVYHQLWMQASVK